jgi:hypothetical protein
MWREFVGLMATKGSFCASVLASLLTRTLAHGRATGAPGTGAAFQFADFDIIEGTNRSGLPTLATEAEPAPLAIKAMADATTSKATTPSPSTNLLFRILVSSLVQVIA